MLSILPEVKPGDGMGGEKHVPNAIGSGRPQCYCHSPKGLTDLEDPSKDRDPAFVAYTPYKVAWRVL